MVLELGKKIHLVGIKGTGMSALALALASLGVKVTGSDSPDSFFLLAEKNFKKARIRIFPRFSPDNISRGTGLVVASTAYGNSNPEVSRAKELGIPVWDYPKMLGLLTKTLPSVAVCGSHGKTTTTNLLAFVARDNGLPALVIGGPTSQQVLDITLRQAQGKQSKPKLFIFEADEYQNKLRYYHPRGVILTNVELDHPDYFKSPAQYKKVFSDFVRRIPRKGFLVYCADDKNARDVARLSRCRKFPYGNSKYAVYRTADFSYPTRLLGEHSRLNTTAVILAARLLGLTDVQIKKSLPKFKGAHRRMQKISLPRRQAGDKPLIYDDYGHHPTEIAATLKALRQAYPDKTIWTVFHPHTFTRTKKFLKQFGRSFADSNRTIVLDIYGSAREKQGTIHSRDVVREIKKNGSRAIYIPTMPKAAKFLKKKLNKNTLLLTIGAGDVWKIHKML